MRAIGNLIWFIFGGVLMGLAWCIIGLAAYLSVIGIPWGKACFVIGQFSFLPFGKEAINRKELTLNEDIGAGAFGMMGNVVWFILAGLWLAIGHIVSALACFITIIGIPFGIQQTLTFKTVGHCPLPHRKDNRHETGSAAGHHCEL